VDRRPLRDNPSDSHTKPTTDVAFLLTPSLTHLTKGSSNPSCTDLAASSPVALMRAVQTTFTSQVRNYAPHISPSLSVDAHTVNSPLPLKEFPALEVNSTLKHLNIFVLGQLLTECYRTTSQVCCCPVFGAMQASH
jgi:hypothetical protein